MMNSEISDALSAALEGYLRFFDTTTALGGALFGAAVFLIIRAVGIIKDKDVAQIQNRSLIVATGLSALIMIILGFIAQNVALSFNVEVLRVEPFGSLRDLCGLMVSDASAAIPDVVVGT